MIGNAVATVVVARWENELDTVALEEQLAGLKATAPASQPI
jgi:Na+/H+-dicarboxylate symporter